MSGNDFPLGVGDYCYSDLFDPLRLKSLHAEFWKFAEAAEPGLRARFEQTGTGTLAAPEEADVLVQGARRLGDFLAKLFHLTSAAAKIKTSSKQIQPIFRFKREFLNVHVFKRFQEAPMASDDFKRLDDLLERILSQASDLSRTDEELRLAEATLFLQFCEKKLAKEPLAMPEQQRAQSFCSLVAGEALLDKIRNALVTIQDWCVQVYVDPRRRPRVADWQSYIRPDKLDFDNLVPLVEQAQDGYSVFVASEDRRHYREGFKLTDARMNSRQVLREIDYCLLCHQRKKDSCRHGFEDKAGGYQRNPLGIALKGCPLDERISEMHQLRKEGELLGALAMIMLDNPMCPGTGHRICNDCMKGCIFQKQDPVNIPQNETGVLTEVLGLNYGVEIYGLLTRFNPLNRRRPYLLPYNGKNVLVVGLGPAGYTLCHYLSNEGFGVIGIDALKVEPLDPTMTGKGRPFPKPVQNFSELRKELDERVQMGFGGVSEYGITVRWDKNFLNLMYLTLARRQNIEFFGGVRFGGTLTLEDAWTLGFDHVALATGAGKPTLVPMRNNLTKGMRQASDFLMSLQLSVPFKKNSLTNLQVRLPALVIGGGLTAIDTATELLAYYPVQVEKTLERYEALVTQFGPDAVTGMCDEEERAVLKTFLEHGAAIREERRVAEREKRPTNFAALCQSWGGVSLVYRRKLKDAPAYRLNHEEVALAMEEGIGFIEEVTPMEAQRDSTGSLSALLCRRPDGSETSIPARSVCVAAGTSPNTMYETEFPGTFSLDDRKSYFRKFRAVREDGKVSLVPAAPGESGGFFASYENEGRLVSFYGDNHPDYAGNVVKAMASAKHGYERVAELFCEAIAAAERATFSAPQPFSRLVGELQRTWIPRVVEVKVLTPTIAEVIVTGRSIARNFQPGQFYRLQNYEAFAPTIGGSRLVMEGLALTGAWVDKEKDLLSLIVLEMGSSSRLCRLLKPGEPVVVMGPTGTPTEIPHNETVALVGGGLGNAVLLSVSRALRANGCKVIYFAGYKRPEDVFYPREIEEGTDQIVWSVDRGRPIPANRPQDLTFVGNIVQSMLAYSNGKFPERPLVKPIVKLNEVDRIIVIGSDRMMAAVAQARHTVLKPHLKSDHVAIGSINSPMQCMMKEVCAQCLQRHVDPVTGKETFVFSCVNQDQPLDHVDFANLNERLRVNSLQEKLSNRYLDSLFEKAGRHERV